MSRCEECGAELPAHYGSCSNVTESMRTVLAGIDREAEERRRTEDQRHRVTISSRQQGKTLAAAKARVKAVGEGRTINGTYRMLPEPALEAFRTDLLLLVAACP